VKEALVNLAS